MDELDFEPMRLGMAPQETLLIFGVRPVPTSIIVTKDAAYDPVRDAKALLFTLSNGLDPQTFQQFCEMIASIYIQNAAQQMTTHRPEPSKPQMKRVPNWVGRPKGKGNPFTEDNEESFEADEDPETD